MKSHAEIRAAAREAIKGKLGKFFVAALIIIVISGICGGITGAMQDAESTVVKLIGGLLSIVAALISLFFTIGYTKMFMNTARGKDFEIKELFNKDNCSLFVPMIVASILEAIFVAVGSIVVIPGIIMAFSYAFVTYMVIDNGEGAPNLRACREMMKGHKWDYFVFAIKFFGWMLLTLITAGIAGIYTIPYMETASIMYYDQLKSNQ